MEKKYYQLGTYTESQWDELHAELIADNSGCVHVPERCVECADDQLHSPTRGTYLLTDEEAAALKNDPRVKFINIDYKRYSEYTPPKDELQATRPELVARYSNTVKNYREFEVSDTLPVSPDATDANRTGYQLYRCQQKLDPWVDGSLADNDIPEVNIFQYGSGRHVDVIVADEGMWLGHPEFQNNSVLRTDGVTPIEKPNGYIGGNLLPGNGTCDVLDLVLDGPYYLDPEWFDSSPETRLTTRWDGTVVPVESVARTWWSNASQRSAKFAGAGTVSVSANYTRLNTSGDNTQRPPISPPFIDEGSHGTPCGALTYGRTHGWAYNANKWTLDLYGAYGSGIEQGFDIQKIFHRLKPVNPLYGTKNPTVSSNSWGYRASKGTFNGYYHFREDAPVQYPGPSLEPAFISHMGATGDTGRWKSEMKVNSLTTALDELIAAGVIFVAAAGNSNQKQVSSDHPDWNNYVSATPTQTLEESSYFEFSVETTGSTNRRGFPQQGGMFNDSNNNRIYPVINIGALDDDYNTGLESKVEYSDRGNEIDVYAPADGTLSANKSYSNEGPRPDTYPGFTFNGGLAYDTGFSGTSAACPVAAGFLATVLEWNRDWTWREVKDWLRSLDIQDPSDFYYGVESTTALSANWFDYESLEGGDARVVYQGIFNARFRSGTRKVTSGLQVKGFRFRK